MTRRQETGATGFIVTRIVTRTAAHLSLASRPQPVGRSIMWF